MYSSSAAAFFFLIFFFIEIRHDLKVFPLEASEQSVVWVLIVFFFFVFFFVLFFVVFFFVCPRYPGKYYNSFG